MPTTPTTELDPEVLKARIERFRHVQSEIVTQVRRVIVGQEEVLEQIMIGLFVGGHCLITGLPGTAKTLLVRTMAQTLGLVYKRIQFTPDLMPSDITGTDIIEEDPTTGHRRWTFVPGPIFGNVLLADEINRTPPKTQSALLEAMQELSCTVRGNTYKLEAPFFVLATQNPIELEGTYPLPEAQLDRFLFKLEVTRNPASVLQKIVQHREIGIEPRVDPVMTREDLLD
ncbi:MAG TPA: AAA family ATPase, partial [Bryobacteraceae bacterium]|nr:AAA family ATPase [Bryobacteraceae bacterium]